MERGGEGDGGGLDITKDLGQCCYSFIKGVLSVRR